MAFSPKFIREQIKLKTAINTTAVFGFDCGCGGG
jgi:hypothetical protein